MKPHDLRKYRSYGLILCLSVIFACQQTSEVPVPEGTAGFETPQVSPFKMPEAKPFTWKEIPQDSVPVGRTMKFDLDKLPTTNLDLQAERQLEVPITERPFSIEDLETIPFETFVEQDSISPIIQPIAEPTFVELNTPQKADNTNAGLLKIAEAEGLLGNVIYYQKTDPNGYHWISTEKALIKFVGDGFETYKIVPESFSGIQDAILQLEFLPDGRGFATTLSRGFYILDWEKGVQEYYEGSYGFAKILIDSEGVIWAGTIQNGLKIIDLEKKTISVISTENLPFPGIFGAQEDSKGNIWLGSVASVGFINPEKTKIYIFDDFPKIQQTPFYDFTEDENGTVWFSSFSFGLKGISLSDQKIKFIGEEQGFSGQVVNLQIDTSGKLWIGSVNTFTVFDPENETLKTINTNQSPIGGGPPSFSLIDENGLYWYGTKSSGLLVYDPEGMDARHFNTDDGLVSNDVWGIGQDSKDRVWLATYGGINIYNPNDGSLKLLQYKNNLGSNDQRGLTFLSEDEIFIGAAGGFSLIDLKSNTMTFYEGNSELARFFWRAIKDRNGLIWIASNNGLILFDREKNTMKKLDAFSGLAGNTAYSVIGPDKKGLIWIVTDSGINSIDPENSTMNFLGIPEGLLSENQSVAFERSNGMMVIGGAGGVSLINSERDSIINIDARHGLIPETLYDAIEINGRLHIGSSNGIIIIDEPDPEIPGSDWKFTKYNRDEGFPYSDYNQLTATQTKDGAVWWAASPIMSVVFNDPDTHKSLSNEALITGIKIMDQNPVFYNPKTNGYSELDSLSTNSSKSYLEENNIRWSGITKRTGMPLDLSLPHHQNSLTFDFSNPTIRSRDDLEYKYLLQGHDSEWSENTRASSSNTYFNLLPGNYEFKVITKGRDGVWSEPAVFAFTINPPWWATWWAFFIYAFALALLIYIIVQLRSSYLKRENRLLEERVNHRTSQLKKSIEELKSTQEQLIQSEKMASLGELTAGIAHEIQNPLNFVNNFSEVSNELIQEIREEQKKEKSDQNLVNEILGDIEENLSKINHHGKRADSIVKGMLQHSRNSSNDKELSDINVIADEYLRLSYHGLRAKDKSFTAEFKLDLDESIPKIEIVPQDLGRVLLNLINNGFYAAGEKKQKLNGSQEFMPSVTVSTKKHEDGVEIRVRDNGEGIPEDIKSKIFQPFFTTKPTGKGTGLGLSMSYDIITKGHEGTLEVESKKGEYTEFIIILPN